MGIMIDGVWHIDEPPKTGRDDGAFERSASLVRNWVTADGSAGPSGEAGFAAEAGRYHLYAAWNCPWAHRAVLVRLLKKLEGIVGLSVVAPRRTEQGWVFDPAQGYADDVFASEALHELYSRGVPGYSGRVTVPVLWDTQTDRIVSNESADIVRMLNGAFAGIAPGAPDLVPEHLREQIDIWNDRIYRTLNNGVYRAGFARTQEAYDGAVKDVFDTLDAIDQCLGQSRYLCGERLTEADWRLFPTLVRFDAAYVGAFKCNLRRLTDYEHIWPYTRELYQMPGIAGTVRPDLYKQGYYSPSPLRNPYGIVPKGPDIDFSAPHGRA